MVSSYGSANGSERATWRCKRLWKIAADRTKLSFSSPVLDSAQAIPSSAVSGATCLFRTRTVQRRAHSVPPSCWTPSAPSN